MYPLARSSRRVVVVVVATADGGVHADQSLGEMRHDKKKKGRTSWDPRKGCGKSDLDAADAS